MSGETEQAVSGWTTDTLHSHLMRLLELNMQQSAAAIDAVDTRANRRIDELAHLLSREIATHDQRHAGEAEALTHRMEDARAALEAALASAQRANDKAETAQQLRNDDMNHVREQQRDLLSEFARSDFVNQVREALDRQVAEVTERVRSLELTQSQSAGHGEGGTDRTIEGQRAIAARMQIIAAVIAVVSIAVTVLIVTRG